MGDRIRTIVIVVVTVVWTLNFVASVAIPGYEAPPEINAIFMGIVGAAFVTTTNHNNSGNRTPARRNPTNGPEQTEEEQR